MLASSGEITAPCGVPTSPGVTCPSSDTPAGLQPFTDQSDHPPVANPVFHETDQPIMPDRIEKARDVGVQYPVHLSLADPDRQRVQRIVLATPWPEHVAEPQEVFLPDRGQHFDQRALDNLVLQRGYAQRTLAAIRFGYIHPSGWLRPIGTPGDTVVQVCQFGVKTLAVRRPGHPIHSRRCLLSPPAIS
jgi:hypothetical protein